ncbi:MAG: hypothetical protein AAGB04_15170 [Pseudomonadota bacterium]
MTLRHLDAKLSGNAYAHEIDAALPRVLAMADCDPLSATRGVGDRSYWAWKLVDFPNATYQGGVNGCAELLECNMFAAGIERRSILHRIRDSIRGLKSITRRDGSLEEAFPYERSYCVTALIAYDVLRAHANLSGASDARDIWRELDMVVGPLVRFLIRNDETHGLISNHLATAVAALYRWHALTGDGRARSKGDALMRRILDNASDEGWFREYGGADPGYQTLCMTYLADVLDVSPNDELRAALHRAVSFLCHFVHPDGSFAGLYGARATRIYYPAGIEYLASENEKAAALAAAMRNSISRHATVPLTAIDQPNLMPLFNAYCRALSLCNARGESEDDFNRVRPERKEHLPAFAGRTYRRHFEGAGIVVDAGRKHYTVVSCHKGGVVFHWRDTSLALCDPGVAVSDGRGSIYTGQRHEPENVTEFDAQAGTLRIMAKLRQFEQPLPSPLRFIALRIMNVTVMRLSLISDLIKRGLVRLLITGKRSSIGFVTRSITLGHDLEVTDALDTRIPVKQEFCERPFSVIHMASQGYWQRQDDGNSRLASNSDMDFQVPRHLDEKQVATK